MANELSTLLPHKSLASSHNLEESVRVASNLPTVSQSLSGVNEIMTVNMRIPIVIYVNRPAKQMTRPDNIVENFSVHSEIPAGIIRLGLCPLPAGTRCNLCCIKFGYSVISLLVFFHSPPSLLFLSSGLSTFH